jgi:hypothetical protein
MPLTEEEKRKIEEEEYRKQLRGENQQGKKDDTPEIFFRFINYINKYDGWILKGKGNNYISYGKSLAGQLSCLTSIAMILLGIVLGLIFGFLVGLIFGFLVGIAPIILYLVFGSKSVEETISLVYNPNTKTINFSGTNRGRRIYEDWLISIKNDEDVEVIDENAQNSSESKRMFVEKKEKPIDDSISGEK